jgi:hypothetical protein
MVDYIKWIRGKVGYDTIILNFAGAIITNDKGEVLQKKEVIKRIFGGFQEERWKLGNLLKKQQLENSKKRQALIFRWII